MSHPKVNFLSKVHELLEIHRGKDTNYVIKPGVCPDKVQTKQIKPGMHETSQTTRIDMAVRAFVE